MPCPKCGSNELWDDEMWWGCAAKSCDFMTNSIRNNLSRSDVFNRGTPEEWPKQPRLSLRATCVGLWPHGELRHTVAFERIFDDEFSPFHGSPGATNRKAIREWASRQQLSEYTDWQLDEDYVHFLRQDDAVLCLMQFSGTEDIAD